MFINPESKIIANSLRQNSAELRRGIYQVFEQSIVGCRNEVQFINNLSQNMKIYFSSTHIGGHIISCNSNVIHKKPIVKMLDRSESRELGDLLVVVKYHLPSGVVESKSAIYQVKLAEKKGSTKCTIDQEQLGLLCDWPPFSFGLASHGGPQNYHVTPNTLEFGSYMLEKRNPSSGEFISRTGTSRCYGVTPHALLVRSTGPNSVYMETLPYTRDDAASIFSQLIFETGEHHCNSSVKNLIDALYRHVGMAPDPPDEFEGYWKEIKEDGFGIIEINVKDWVRKVRSILIL